MGHHAASWAYAEIILQAFFENLSGLLGNDPIYHFPWKRSVEFSYQVLVRIPRFDTSSEGNALLDVRREIRGHKESDVFDIRQSRFQVSEKGQAVSSNGFGNGPES